MTMPPSEAAIPVDNVGQLLTNALVDAGVVGIDEDVEQPILNRAFRQANWLLAEWARKRWMVYRIQDYAFQCTGANTYSVGAGQTVNINPRPDRLEYAFIRFLPAASGSGSFSSDYSPDFATGGGFSNALPVDIQLHVITSHEEYSRITVKQVGTFARSIFYDPAWPVGILVPWPVPQATIYEIHVGFKVVIPRFTGLTQAINFPPEYESALNWSLARRFRATYQMPPDPTIDSLARNGMNTIRLANAAMPTLQLPRVLSGRSRAYDYRSDGN